MKNKGKKSYLLFIVYLIVGLIVSLYSEKTFFGAESGLLYYIYVISLSLFLSLLLKFIFEGVYSLFRSLLYRKKEYSTAQVILNNLKKEGILEVSLADLSHIWSDNHSSVSDEKQEEIRIDMSKMYHFWRDETAIEIHAQEEKGFANDRIKKFFQDLKEVLKVEEKLGSPDVDSDLEKSVFQAEYRIILFLLSQLDEYGHCPSVVSKVGDESKSGEPDNIKTKQSPMEILTVDLKARLKKDASNQISLPFKNTYEILRNINLADHSINVAENIIKLIENDENDEIYKNTMLPIAVIAALAHDIGKIPEYYTGIYNKLTHQLISAKILEEFIDGYSQSLKKTLDQGIIEIMVEAVKNHHAFLTPAAATESRFRKIIDYLKKADSKARTQEIAFILEQYGFLKDSTAAKESKNKKMTTVNNDPENSSPVTSDIGEFKNTLERMNKNTGIDSDLSKSGRSEKQSEPRKPVSSYTEKIENEFKNKLDKKKNTDSRVVFKYPDFDRYTGIKPSEDEEREIARAFLGNYKDTLLDEIPGWMNLPEAIQTGLEIIEERINYCKLPREGSDPIVGIFSIKGTVFVLSTVMMAVVHYVGEKLYNDSVVSKPYYQRGVYLFSYVNAIRKLGIIDERNIKISYFAAPFTIFLTDANGNHLGTRSGKYTPLNLEAIASYFSKSVDYYEERKKNPVYCPTGYLLKMTGFRWG